MIIVPALLVPGNLALTNVKRFLEEGFYEESPKSSERLQATQVVTLKKTLNGKQVLFDVYDSVANFSDSRWSRVVAVFVNGQDWQFKDWRPTGGSGTELNKRELFARVRGYFFNF